jgi:hypothetical protein
MALRRALVSGMGWLLGSVARRSLERRAGCGAHVGVVAGGRIGDGAACEQAGNQQSGIAERGVRSAPTTTTRISLPVSSPGTFVSH